MISSANIEPYPGSKSSNDAWISEAIWGHRLERQPFSALLLEFLGMAEGMYREGKLLAETRPGDNPEYAANRSLQLRNLLFNNPRMEEILRNAQGSDEDGWKEWLPVMKESASLGEHLSADFTYLRQRFDTFEELVSVIRLLRRITVDPGSERGWTTQFVYPIGPAALYEAILAKCDGFELTRRVFTRTGEMAYLMLSRASASLRERIRSRLMPSFDPKTSRNRLIMRLLSDSKPDSGPRKSGTYLPYKTHPAFDRMAEDIAAILELNLPDQDAFQFLGPLLGFHLYLYGIETANQWVGKVGLTTLLSVQERLEQTRNLRDALETAILSSYPGAFVVGALSDRLPTTTFLCIPGVDAEDLVDQMAMNGVAISAGSACSFGARRPSHVAMAYGLTYEQAKSCVRLSLSVESTREEVDSVLRVFENLNLSLPSSGETPKETN